MCKKLLQIIEISVFTIIILVVPILSFFLKEDSTENLEEKRILAEFPTEINRGTFKNLEIWYNDHIPFRMTLISMQKTQGKILGKWYRENLHPLISMAFTPAWYPQNEKQKSQQYFAPIEEDGVVYGRDDWLFYTLENNISFYRGSNIPEKQIFDQWKSTYIELNNICSQKDISLVIVIAPNKEQVYSEYMPSYYIVSEKKREFLFNEIMEDTDVAFLYPMNALTSAKEKYPVYYKQDTHWSSYGAFVCAEEIFPVLNREMNGDTVIEKTIKCGGDLSNFCGLSTEYEDYSVLYCPTAEIKTTELYKDLIIEYNNENCDSGTLVLIGDSFRTALSPILAKEFKTTYTIHRRELHNPIVEDQILSLTKGDTIILLAVERYDEDNVKAAEKIINCLKQS